MAKKKVVDNQNYTIIIGYNVITYTADSKEALEARLKEIADMTSAQTLLDSGAEIIVLKNNTVFMSTLDKSSVSENESVPVKASDGLSVQFPVKLIDLFYQ